MSYRFVPLAFFMGALLALAAGCDNGIKVGNLPGHVAFVGPTASDDQGVATFFGVVDLERNILDVDVEICPEGASCFVPEVLSGSSTLDAVPAVDKNTASALRLLWRPCEVGDTTPLLGAQTEFSVVMSVANSDVEPVRSPVTTLESIGVDPAELCR